MWQFGEVFQQILRVGVFFSNNKHSFTVGGRRSKATSEKSQSFATDIWISQMENSDDF